MTPNHEFEAMIEACLKAHEAVAQAGTPEMRTLTRLLLFEIGREIAHHLRLEPGDAPTTMGDAPRQLY